MSDGQSTLDQTPAQISLGIHDVSKFLQVLLGSPADDGVTILRPGFHFPDGGGVYSAARSQGRLLAVVGALLLLADLTVTAALSGWSALSYITSGAEQVGVIKLLREHIALATIAMLVIMGVINFFGPKHSGSLAVALAAPTLIVVVVLIAISAPHLTTKFLQPRHESLTQVWAQFVGVILALSGAESIANITGVMKLDPGSTMEHPSVARESTKAITPVAIEVVLGTALLGWAMLSLPSVLGKTLHLTDKAAITAVLEQRREDMFRFIGEQFATATFSPAAGQIFGWIVGIVFCLLLLSAANTAIDLVRREVRVGIEARDRRSTWAMGLAGSSVTAANAAELLAQPGIDGALVGGASLKPNDFLAIVQAADAISAARPGARRETIDLYIKRLEALENIANSFSGVEKSFAIQAGREVRIIVRPEEIDEFAANRLASEIAHKIEESLDYPGQIKVQVVRETRSVDYAR